MNASFTNVHRVRNFLNAEEIKRLIDFAEEQPEINQPSRAILQFMPNTSITELIQSYQTNVESLMIQTYGQDITDMYGTTLRKWYPGESQPPHSDCEARFSWNYDTWESSRINNFSSLFIEYAALTYLNEDYEGGELYFPEYEIEIKPSAGELIFFPGNHLYLHGVREVTSGHRYAVMTFFTTPKLQYIWRTFVLDESPIKFSTYSAEDLMEEERIFNKSNIPATMQLFGQRSPGKARSGNLDELNKPF